MADLTDLEITKLCAEVMGFVEGESMLWMEYEKLWILNDGKNSRWNPLHNDEQAMALVKKFRLDMRNDDSDNGWLVTLVKTGVPYTSGPTNDLNRAICECVARIQLERNRG